MSKEKIIGTSNNSMQEIYKSIKAKVDYLAIGKVFETNTMGKRDRNIVGLDLITETKKITNIPIVAIGGINNSNYKKILSNGANFIACSSYIWNNKKLDPVSAISKFK